MADPLQTLSAGVSAEVPSTLSSLADLPTVEPARYRVEGEHARGGRGKVLRAWDRHLARWVAIKQAIEPGDRQVAARLVREALVTARLQHPSIVPTFAAGRWPDGEPFFVMKLVEGESLRQAITSRPRLADRLALLGAVIATADAVSAAHDQGIVHRDLKPANVLLGRFGETVVVDWGMAKDLGAADEPRTGDVYQVAATELTVEGAVLGTPAYMPPEQARGEPVDERADVYALGAMIYHLLAGQPPGAQPGPLADAPEELAAIVRRAMSPRPEDRYLDAQELADDLRRFQTGRLVSAHAYSISALLWRRLRRHRTLVATVAVASLVGAGLYARSWWATRVQVAALTDIAASRRQEARARDAEVERLRAEALARFDAGDLAAGELRWREMREKSRAVDRALAAAGQQLEHALSLADQPRVRAHLADVLLERVRLAERDQRHDEREELVARLESHDVDGSRRARLFAPARLLLRSEVPAQVSAVPIARDELRTTGAPVALGTTPTKAELAPGAHLLRFALRGRAPVVLPVVVRAGEALELDLPEPPAADGVVWVPPARFHHGSGDHDTLRMALTAVPLHELRGDGFLIGRHEVTYAEWITFLEALPPDQREARRPRAQDRGHALELEQTPAGWRLTLNGYQAVAGEPILLPERTRRGRQDWQRWPVSGVSFDDAEAYATWLAASGRLAGARMCSEREWEQAARGADDRRYPHGDRLEPDDANFNLTYGQKAGGFGPDEVGSHPRSRSPFGVDDLAGNVWEWTRSVDGRPVIRGGSFYQNDASARSDNRNEGTPEQRDPLVGVRICATPAPR